MDKDENVVGDRVRILAFADGAVTRIPISLLPTAVLFSGVREYEHEVGDRITAIMLDAVKRGRTDFVDITRPMEGRWMYRRLVELVTEAAEG